MKNKDKKNKNICKELYLQKKEIVRFDGSTISVRMPFQDEKIFLNFDYIKKKQTKNILTSVKNEKEYFF